MLLTAIILGYLLIGSLVLWAAIKWGNYNPDSVDPENMSPTMVWILWPCSLMILFSIVFNKLVRKWNSN